MNRQPAVVKIDKAGFELNVLKSANEIAQGPGGLDHRSPSFAIAVLSEPKHELEAILVEHGLSTRVIDRTPNSLHTIVAEKSS